MKTDFRFEEDRLYDRVTGIVWTIERDSQFDEWILTNPNGEQVMVKSLDEDDLADYLDHYDIHWDALWNAGRIIATEQLESAIDWPEGTLDEDMELEIDDVDPDVDDMTCTIYASNDICEVVAIYYDEDGSWEITEIEFA